MSRRVEGGAWFAGWGNAPPRSWGGRGVWGAPVGFPQTRAAGRCFGGGGFFFFPFLLTFPGIAEDLLGWHYRDVEISGIARAFYQWVPLVLSVAIWGIVAWRSRPGAGSRDESERVGFESWLLPLTAVLCQVLALARFP